MAMNWVPLKTTDQIEAIQQESKEFTVLIFKHSTRCSISQTALDRLERNWNDEEMATIKPYFLDLISFRDISNHIADFFQIEHESPQVLLIKNGSAFYDSSHFNIDYQKIKDVVYQLK